MVTVENADLYFSEVFHNEAWLDLDMDGKQRALTTAERFLSRIVPITVQIPENAIYEQAITLSRIDEGFFQAQAGVTQTSVAGISISYDISKVTLIDGLPISKIALAIMKELGISVRGNSRFGRYRL